MVMDDARQSRVAPTPAKPKNCHPERSRGTCSFSIVRESLTGGLPFPRSVRKGERRRTKRNGIKPNEARRVCQTRSKCGMTNRTLLANQSKPCHPVTAVSPVKQATPNEGSPHFPTTQRMSDPRDRFVKGHGFSRAKKHKYDAGPAGNQCPHP